MVIETGSRPYVCIPVHGPNGWNPQACGVEISLDGEHDAPGAGGWHAAVWDTTISPPEARILAGTLGVGGGAAEYADGDYLAWLRLTASPEQVVLPSGRVRVGAVPE